MKTLNVLSRILFALPFGVAGIMHFIMKDSYLDILEQTTIIPESGYLIFLTGLALIAASVSIILNKFIKLSCFSLAGLLVVFILSIHIPGIVSHASAEINIHIINLLKDTSLAGGATFIATIYNK